MAERSKRICMYDADKMKQINPETLKLFQKYQVDMSIRDLSPNTINGYISDLQQWFINDVTINCQFDRTILLDNYKVLIVYERNVGW